MQNLKLYNSLSRKKEVFKPITEGRVGMYVCGLQYMAMPFRHARPGITFDVVFRYLQHLGTKPLCANITDVGHLVNDADEGEDKIAKKARLDQLEPMEVVAYYTRSYHRDMALLNTLPPSIEPTATGHIIEQIQMIEKILANGYAYES